MSNHLAAETSPYLRQHAGNPVDWWPWCPEALAAARRERRPILLSIGYAACHWCHVMAAESFADPATAALMNALYVNIKVDREERPDLDHIYQLGHQALCGRPGGWPLTMFLRPDDLLPFFSGTYFPAQARPGLPAFSAVLRDVRRWYDQNPAALRIQGAELEQVLHEAGAAPGPPGRELDASPLAVAFQRMSADFDPINGGQRGAPKFPRPTEIAFLLERRAQVEAADMARLSLQRMAAGGIFDQLGGGFFRYSVDAEWDIPHFEKMLGDSAALLPLYAEAGRRFADPLLQRTAQRTADWLGAVMAAPEGGFYSSLDADSAHEEGGFYLWHAQEIQKLLDADEYAVVARRFGLDQAPNFARRAWHLRVRIGFDTLAAELGLTPDAARARWVRARDKLLAARARRPPPGLDDKILTAGCALAVAGAARAARYQDGLQDLVAQAERTLDLLHRELWRDGRLYACRTRGRTTTPAWLDDHAYLLDALLTMLQLRWKRRDLDWSCALADELLARFEDRERGGFFFSAEDGEALPLRPKLWTDDALPCGNGVAARSLLRLGALLGETRWLQAAERSLRAAWPTLREYPQSCCAMLGALDEYLAPRTQLVLRASAAELERWRPALAALDAPRTDVYCIPQDADALPSVLATQQSIPGGAAWVCRGSACLPPITDPVELAGACA